MAETTRKRKKRSNVVGEEEVAARRTRKKRVAAPPRTNEEEAVSDVSETDEILDQVEEERSNEEEPQTLLFESKEVIAEDNPLRFWARKRDVQSLVSSAGSYTSTEVGAPRYLSEIMLEINADESYIRAVGQSEIAGGEFFLYDNFKTAGDESFIFSIDEAALSTALSIVAGDNVTIELIPNEDDETLAELWILDETSDGQNTNFMVTIPDEDNQPSVPAGIEEELIQFVPDSFLDAYAESARCVSNNNNDFRQVFSSIDTDTDDSGDERPFIRFSATDNFHAATSFSWLDKQEGDLLSKINFETSAINRAIPHMKDAVLCQLMISSENEEDVEVEEWENEDTQKTQLVILVSRDEEDRVLSSIKMETMTPSSTDYEELIMKMRNASLDKSSLLVGIKFGHFANALSNARQIHDLRPEDDSGNSYCYLQIKDDTVTVRSHMDGSANNGTKSVHYIEEIDDSGRHNEDFGIETVVQLAIDRSLPIIERFLPHSADDRAVLAFYKANEDDDNFNGFILLREDEAKEWNEDDDLPKFSTIIKCRS